jgi:hypothetical protein
LAYSIKSKRFSGKLKGENVVLNDISVQINQ